MNDEIELSRRLVLGAAAALAAPGLVFAEAAKREFVSATRKGTRAC